MTDEPDNILLVYLRRLDAKSDAMAEKLEEILLRLTRLESGQARIRQDLGGHAETEAHLQAQIDRLRTDVDRINRRLDLTEV